MSSIILILKKIKKIVFLDIDFFLLYTIRVIREMRVQIPRWPATVKLSYFLLTKSECLIVIIIESSALYYEFYSFLNL